MQHVHVCAVVVWCASSHQTHQREADNRRQCALPPPPPKPDQTLWHSPLRCSSRVLCASSRPAARMVYLVGSVYGLKTTARASRKGAHARLACGGVAAATLHSQLTCAHKRTTTICASSICQLRVACVLRADGSPNNMMFYVRMHHIICMYACCWLLSVCMSRVRRN